MREIRNKQGKLVCRLNEELYLIEIVHKGCKTLIRFEPDGKVKVINTMQVA